MKHHDASRILQKIFENEPYRVVVITGSTASGKTALAEYVALQIPCEIINGDVGQLYTPLSIGTAKSTTGNAKGYHGFDIFETPDEYNIAAYTKFVKKCVKEIAERGNVPIIVGGSLFYIKSLFFPPISPQTTQTKQPDIDFSKTDAMLWELLKSIDPDRASVIHPNDRYRIVRALTLWQQNGIKPSLLKAELAPLFKAVVVSVIPERTCLNERINSRTQQMIDAGWIDEARALVGTDWEAFVRRKGMIGYAEIFDWIVQGEKQEGLKELIALIQMRTRQYAGRQKVFWKKLHQDIQPSPLVTTYSVEIQTEESHEGVVQLVKKFLE